MKLRCRCGHITARPADGAKYECHGCHVLLRAPLRRCPTGTCIHYEGHTGTHTVTPATPTDDVLGRFNRLLDDVFGLVHPERKEPRR